jgi:hypothetical protein
MAFVTSTYSAQFAYRLIDAIQTVLERDTGTALTSIDNTLADFVDYQTPTPIVLNFPALYISVGSSAMEQSDDDSHIRSQHEIYIDIAVDGKDAYTLERTILKYVLAVDQVLRTMAAADLITATSSTVSEPIWEVTEHQFGLLRQGDTIYRKDARIVLIVQLLER